MGFLSLTAAPVLYCVGSRSRTEGWSLSRQSSERKNYISSAWEWHQPHWVKLVRATLAQCGLRAISNRRLWSPDGLCWNFTAQRQGWCTLLPGGLVKHLLQKRYRYRRTKAVMWGECCFVVFATINSNRLVLSVSVLCTEDCLSPKQSVQSFMRRSRYE